MSRLRTAFYWAGSCGGCDIAVLDIHEYLLHLAERIDIVFWPCVLDAKRSDLEAFNDASIDVCLYNGAVITEEHREMAQVLRRKSVVLIANGACALDGGIPGLVNAGGMAAALTGVYGEHVPADQTLPRCRTTARTLGDIVPVDYGIPGCPPEPARVREVLQVIVSEHMPPSGGRIGCRDTSVCDECSLERKGTTVRQFKRVHEFVPDSGRCLLEQGLVCMGPATRSGCEARCPSVMMPCRGCYGPAGNAPDQGAAMANLIGSTVEAGSEDDVMSCIESAVDPLGTFYRFSLPGSILGGGRAATDGPEKDEPCAR